MTGDKLQAIVARKHSEPIQDYCLQDFASSSSLDRAIFARSQEQAVFVLSYHPIPLLNPTGHDFRSSLMPAHTPWLMYTSCSIWFRRRG
jgi:hypothetical protein